MKIEPTKLRELAESIGALRFGKRYGYETPIPAALISAAIEIELLRDMLQKAPHDDSVCDVPTALFEQMTVPCTCWKADLA